MGNTQSALLNHGKALRTLGWVLLVAGLAFGLDGQVRTYMQHGLDELLDMVSLRNLAYYRAVAVVLLPGACLVALGQWSVAKRRRRRRRPTYLSDFLLRC